MISGPFLPSLFALLFGAAVGSFANVCIYRLPRQLSLGAARSRCAKCGTAVAAYDNIPVASYLWLAGRCRACGTPFGLRYPLVEAAAALAAWWIYRHHGATLFSAYAFLLFTALMIASAIDLEFRIIPDVISLPGIAAGLAAAALAAWAGYGWPVTPVSSLLGAAAGAGLLRGVGLLYEKATGREGIGLGDVKLLAMFGANAGIAGVLTSLFYGSFFGSAAGIFLIAFRGKGGRYPIPFGPFLCLGFLVHALFGARAIELPLSFLGR